MPPLEIMRELPVELNAVRLPAVPTNISELLVQVEQDPVTKTELVEPLK